MKPLDIDAMLRRGGQMSQAEAEQLARELTAGKLLEMSNGISERSMDQPLRVIPFSESPDAFARGYFTQQKYIWGATPEQMELILGIIGKLRNGACILQFSIPLMASDYENKAYSYLPSGSEYKPDANERMYLPGKGAPQWRLTRPVPATCVARLQPGQPFNKSTLMR